MICVPTGSLQHEFIHLLLYSCLSCVEGVDSFSITAAAEMRLYKCTGSNTNAIHRDVYGRRAAWSVWFCTELRLCANLRCVCVVYSALSPAVRVKLLVRFSVWTSAIRWWTWASATWTIGQRRSRSAPCPSVRLAPATTSSSLPTKALQKKPHLIESEGRAHNRSGGLDRGERWVSHGNGSDYRIYLFDTWPKIGCT